MRTRWVIVFAMVAALGLAAAAAATNQTAKAENPEGVSTSAAQTQGAVVEAPDPYLQDAPVSTEATEGKSCQVFAQDCLFDGGPCGPGGVCHCLFKPSGWVCAR